MNHFSGSTSAQWSARVFLSTVWPLSSPIDSESQRRKKLAVRSAQLAVVVMVLAAVGGSIASGMQQLSVAQVAICDLSEPGLHRLEPLRMRDTVRGLLSEGETAPPLGRPGVPMGKWLYFTGQMALAALVCFLSGQGRDRMLAWLVLLPPVAHAVILLRWPGILMVSALSVATLVFSIFRWHGWTLVPNAVLAFSFAVLFTIVFTLLAVSSENSRAEVQRLASELSEANRKLREYAVQAEELAATRERNRLAREIHDSLGHYLTVVNVQIEAARALQDRDVCKARTALDKAQALTQEGLREIRELVAALRASPLDNKPLSNALQQTVAENCAAGLPTELQVMGETRRLSAQVELTFYRAGQEGLTNVRKHAHATCARLVLDFRARETRVAPASRDDGRGAPPDLAGTGGFGLLGLRERTQLLGGNLKTLTAPGAGFTLELEVPG